MNKPIIWQCIRFLFVVTCVLLFYFMMLFLLGWFYPFLIAFIVAWMIHPLINLLEHKIKCPRGLATFIVLTGLMALLCTVMFLLISEIVDGMIYLADQIPFYFEKGMALLQMFINQHIIPIYKAIMSWVQTLDASQQLTIESQVQHLTSQFSAAGANFLRDILLMMPTFIMAFPNALAIFIFILIATFIIAKDWLHFKHLFKRIVPKAGIRAGIDMRYHLERSIFGFLKAQMLFIGISTSIILLGLWFLKIEHALTIALAIGLIDLLPLIGTGLVFIPWIGYVFFTHHYMLTVGLTIIYMVVIISRQIIEPKILSVNIGINPLLALMILFFSIQLWGVSGILFSPLLLIIISALIQSDILKQISRFIKEPH